VSGPAVEALFKGLAESPLMYLVAFLLCALIAKILGLTDIMLGKFGMKFGPVKKSPMIYVRAMLNVDRQRSEVDRRNQMEARRKTRNMINIVIGHIIAIEVMELRLSVGVIDSRWRDLALRSLLRGEVKDEIMTKSMEIYERNGLDKLSEIELTAKIDVDFRTVAMCCSDIIRDGWANPDITWDELRKVLEQPEYKAGLKTAFAECVKEYRNLSLKKAVEYGKIDDLICAIEDAAGNHRELPPGCFDTDY